MSDLMKAKQYFLSCAACALGGVEPEALPEDVDENLVYNISVRNNAQVMLYFVNEKKRIFSDDITLRLKKAFQAATLREAAQQGEMDRIRREFSEQGIKFILLKGAHLKALYPHNEMRFMVDMDVLVQKEDVDRAREILISHGLRQKMDNGKDIVLVKIPFLTVELHNTLFTEDNYMYGYFLGVWDRAEAVDGFEYRMSDSDLYIYTLAHLAEHYTSAGACFRPTADIYLLSEKRQLDREYIAGELEEISLNGFDEKIRAVGKCMFEGSRPDEALELMTNYILFGPPVKNANEAADSVRTGQSKFTRILKMLFPDMSHMSKLFPILLRLPFLLPFFWAVRFFKYAFTKKAREKLRAVSSTETGEMKALREIYEKSGITRY